MARTIKQEASKPRATHAANEQGQIIRALRHIADDPNKKYYLPGDVIEGWDAERIAKYEAAGLVSVEGVL